MSLKLHITIDGEEFPIYPTPTYITHMCMATDFSWSARLTEDKAKRAINSYIFWAHQMHPGEALNELYKAIKLGTEFEVYAQ